jgi:uncharacterized protein YheU (UPF0270 family)
MTEKLTRFTFNYRHRYGIAGKSYVKNMKDEFSQMTPEEREPQEEGVEVAFDLLQPETLEQLIRDFVLREGTDYGDEEVPFARKVGEVREQIKKGDLKIVFDLSTETGSIVSVR